MAVSHGALAESGAAPNDLASPGGQAGQLRGHSRRAASGTCL